MTGLYVHVPFCLRRCTYCDFYSLARSATPGGPADYLEALAREIALLPADFQPDTVFIGGGTPTELDATDLRHLLALLRERIDLSRVVEWSCEANPGTLTGEKAEALLAAGVNRFSLGVQSFQPAALALLDRIHGAEEAVESVRLLRRLGVDNLNLDLLYGIPGAPDDAVDRDLDQLLDLAPEHAACYCLIFEPGTPLERRRARGELRAVDDETERSQYTRIRSRLTSADYTHYELSNFARSGHTCRHNLLYWSGGSYLALGPAAHAHWDGRRTANPRNLAVWSQRLAKGLPPHTFEERLAPEAKARETLVMALRQIAGVRYNWFHRATGFDLRALCGPTLDHLAAEGLLVAWDEGVRLSADGLFVSDGIFAELV